MWEVAKKVAFVFLPRGVEERGGGTAAEGIGARG